MCPQGGDQAAVELSKAEASPPSRSRGEPAGELFAELDAPQVEGVEIPQHAES
jgi:hypothetical protein